MKKIIDLYVSPLIILNADLNVFGILLEFTVIGRLKFSQIFALIPQNQLQRPNCIFMIILMTNNLSKWSAYRENEPFASAF